MKNYYQKTFVLIPVVGLIIMIQSCKKTQESTIPVLTTSSVASITDMTAVSGGTITDDGGAQITDRGLCWGTLNSPVVMGSHSSDGSGIGTFIGDITGLTTGTSYYLRAYATNSVGTAYGNELTFTTTSESLASLTTTSVSAISTYSAECGGTITDDKGSDITARGTCWSTNINPTIADSHTTDGVGTGSFTSNLTGLRPLTKYYLRAYATSSAGTVYGLELFFTTKVPEPEK